MTKVRPPAWWGRRIGSSLAPCERFHHTGERDTIDKTKLALINRPSGTTQEA